MVHLAAGAPLLMPGTPGGGNTCSPIEGRILHKTFSQGENSFVCITPSALYRGHSFFSKFLKGGTPPRVLIYIGETSSFQTLAVKLCWPS